ncbi:MAG: tetratricopeptide repeat protein [Betaproteobacteria bacterium]
MQAPVPDVGDDPRTLTAAARAAYLRGDLAAARMLADQVLARAPGHAPALNLLGNLHLADGLLDDAERCYRAALAADANLRCARFNLGLVCLERGDRAGAIRELEQALEETSDAEDWLLLGNLLHGEGRADAALAHWTRATIRNPALVEAWFNLGSVQRALGRRQDARAALERAQQLQPGAAAIRLELGLLDHAQGRYAAALEQFRHAVAADPANVDARVNLAETLRIVGSSADAATLLAEVVSDHPDAGNAHKALGLIALSEARPADAAVHFRTARESLPEDPEIAHLLAAAEGRTADAAPADYVRSLFDGFAVRFDEELTRNLGYRTPGELAAALRECLPEPPPPLRVADLGCGTGLAGVALGTMCASLVGVDLSPRMLDEARARNLYSELVCQDLVAFLNQGAEARFDALVAADVFIYVGRLDAVFAAGRRALAHGGHFAFSLELAAEGGDAQAILRPSGRFAHRPDAVRALAETTGFATLAWRETILRHDRDEPVRGLIAVLAAR